MKTAKKVREKIYDVMWEGPYNLEVAKKRSKKDHVLYAIFGTHSVYGQNVLLYIGLTETTVAQRLSEHTWLRQEYDVVTVRFASIGEFPDIESWWKDWMKNNRDKKDRTPYRRPKSNTIQALEKILIYAHQPACNSKNIEEFTIDNRLDIRRIFNTGRLGPLLPEISEAYFTE